jgi:D-glycero-alpha-D-manno-heptose-7-phosphate kinase
MSRALVARAPTRIDFGGGWTDVPPYPVEQGGAVCNIAITRYATATAALGADVGVTVGVAGRSGDAVEHPLVEAALRRSALRGARASVTNDFPIGAGLGGSSAAGVALAGALAALAGETIDRAGLAERSRATECEELGIAGGFQDHYAAAYGGALLLTFTDCVGVEQIALTPAIREAFAARALLIHTGESRVSGSMIQAVLDAYRAGDARVCGALARMKALAPAMAASLRRGDLDALGAQLGEHWAHQRALHPAISTARIDSIMQAAARAGATGGKALGASGGGCVIVMAASGREHELATALAPLGERLTFGVDERGVGIMAALPDEEIGA